MLQLLGQCSTPSVPVLSQYGPTVFILGRVTGAIFKFVVRKLECAQALLAQKKNQWVAIIPKLCASSKPVKHSVRKQSPCLLSFEYTSYIRYGVRAAPKFGNHVSLFLYCKDKNYV